MNESSLLSSDTAKPQLSREGLVELAVTSAYSAAMTLALNVVSWYAVLLGVLWLVADLTHAWPSCRSWATVLTLALIVRRLRRTEKRLEAAFKDASTRYDAGELNEAADTFRRALSVVSARPDGE